MDKIMMTPVNEPQQVETNSKTNINTDSKANIKTNIKTNMPVLNQSVGNLANNKNQVYELTPEKLQEAILWSEILGKPVCKRRKCRVYR